MKFAHLTLTSTISGKVRKEKYIPITGKNEELLNEDFLSDVAESFKEHELINEDSSIYKVEFELVDKPPECYINMRRMEILDELQTLSEELKIYYTIN